MMFFRIVSVVLRVILILVAIYAVWMLIQLWRPLPSPLPAPYDTVITGDVVPAPWNSGYPQITSDVYAGGDSCTTRWAPGGFGCRGKLIGFLVVREFQLVGRNLLGRPLWVVNLNPKELRHVKLTPGVIFTIHPVK